jgi:hypothetical protein
LIQRSRSLFSFPADIRRRPSCVRGKCLREPRSISIFLSWPHPNIWISYHGAAGRSPPVFCRERGGITGPETIRPDRILPEGLWLFAVLGFPRAIDLMVGVRWITARFSYRSCRDYVPIHGDGVDHPRFRPAFPESRLLTGAGFVLLARFASPAIYSLSSYRRVNLSPICATRATTSPSSILVQCFSGSTSQMARQESPSRTTAIVNAGGSSWCCRSSSRIQFVCCFWYFHRGVLCKGIKGKLARGIRLPFNQPGYASGSGASGLNALFLFRTMPGRRLAVRALKYFCKVWNPTPGPMHIFSIRNSPMEHWSCPRSQVRKRRELSEIRLRAKPKILPLSRN